MVIVIENLNGNLPTVYVIHKIHDRREKKR